MAHLTDEKLIVHPNSKIKLKNYDPKYTGKYKKKIVASYEKIG